MNINELAFPIPLKFGDQWNWKEWGSPYGLSKYEYFANNAPPMPSWFEEKYNKNFPKPNWPMEPVTEELQEERHIETAEWKESLYFAWRCYYAKRLLRILEG